MFLVPTTDTEKLLNTKVGLSIQIEYYVGTNIISFLKIKRIIGTPNHSWRRGDAKLY